MKSFNQITKKTNGISLVNFDRQKAIYDSTIRCSKLDGDIAEVGVYKGGTAYILCNCAPSKKVYLFDTFTGMPSLEKDIDDHKGGDFSNTSLDSVQKYLSEYNNIEYRIGIFPETAKDLDCKFCLVHLDGDLYQTTLDGIEYFWPKLSIGGCIIFDDYEWHKCEGVKKAIDKFFSNIASDKFKRYQSAKYQLTIDKIRD